MRDTIPLSSRSYSNTEDRTDSYHAYTADNQRLGEVQEADLKTSSIGDAIYRSLYKCYTGRRGGAGSRLPDSRLLYEAAR